VEIVSKYFADFTETQAEQFRQLEGIYKEWNEKINVISRKDIDTLYERHVLHSLAIAVVCPFDDGAEIVDIGTGGGFPGIPLAIFFPNVNFLLVDSIGKKIKVVNEVAQAIGLKNVTTIHGRVEGGQRPFFRLCRFPRCSPIGRPVELDQSQDSPRTKEQ
jgi:16S rRNA (guanine527-N7)-methyltransferase